MIVSPTQFLQAKLDPISSEIDGMGGFNLICGFIAAGGEPHIYIIGNLDKQPTLAQEIYEGLGKKLLELGSRRKPESKLIINPGAI